MELLDGRLDILVQAAGVQRRHKAEEFPLEDWEFVLDVNLTAVFKLASLRDGLCWNREAERLLILLLC